MTQTKIGGLETDAKYGETIVVDPANYFAGWAYTIRPELFAALGVYPRQVIDKEKTELARGAAMARGTSPADATKRIRVMRREIVINAPPVYCFEIGDIYYRGVFGGTDWAQVMAVDAKPGGIFIEAHWPLREGRIGFNLPASDFERCLRTGNLPDRRCRIGISQRSSLILMSDLV